MKKKSEREGGRNTEKDTDRGRERATDIIDYDPARL